MTEPIGNNFGNVRREECDSVARLEPGSDLNYSYEDGCWYAICQVCGSERRFGAGSPVVQRYIYHRINHR